MASDYRIIADGVTIYLNNINGVPTCGGAATGVSTTPWMIREPWTLTAAQPETLLAGGPPFRNGSVAVNQAYPVVTETIPLVLNGGTHDTLIARLQQLRQLSNQAIFGLPAVLYAQPGGASQPVYFELLAAMCQERSADGGESPGEGATLIHVDLTITRSALGGRLTSGETLINAQTYTVAGSTSTLPTNSVSLGSPAGDLIYEGSPLNIKVTPTTGGSDIGELWAASIYTQITATANAPLTAITAYTPVTALWTPTNLLIHNGSKLRVIARVTNSTGGAISKYYIIIRGALGISSPALWSSNAAGVSPTVESTGLVDFGPIPLDFLRTISPLTGTITIEFYATKTAGTATLISVELLIYNDFAKISNLKATQAGGQYVWLQGFRAKSGQVCLESPNSASTLTSGDGLHSPATVRGRLPRAFSGTSLWLNWLDSTGNNTTTGTRAASVTATHGPQYKTFRGNG